MRNNDSYTALAEVYDSLMYDVDYDRWAAYMIGLIGEPPKKVAEVACGTGNLTLRLLQAGYDVVASDASEEMIGLASKKAAKAGIGGCFMAADMRAPVCFGADVVISAMDGVNYLTEDGDAGAFFEAAYASLKPGGRLLFDISSEYKLREIVGDNFFYDDGDDVTYYWENEICGNAVNMELTIFIRDGEVYRRGDESHTQRIYERAELERLLSESGFGDIEVFGFGTLEEPDENAERLQFSAIKKG